MRKALNENPLVQAAAIGVLALVVGFLLITRMSGGPDAAADPVATTDPATGAVADPAAAVPAPADAVPTGPASVADAVPADPTMAPAGASAFKPGPGLPKEVVEAYDDGKVIVLLVIRNSGIDDRRVETMVESLRGRSDLGIFTTRADKIANYSRITQGVEVTRVPALVVIQPKKLSVGPLPSASVSYGFRSVASVKQAIADALYAGHSNLPYYPK